MNWQGDSWVQRVWAGTPLAGLPLEEVEVDDCMYLQFTISH
jgi:hypothetical protein